MHPLTRTSRHDHEVWRLARSVDPQFTLSRSIERENKPDRSYFEANGDGTARARDRAKGMTMELELIATGEGVSPEVCAHLRSALPQALAAFESSVLAVRATIRCTESVTFVHLLIDVGTGSLVAIDDDDPCGRALVGRLASRAADAVAVRLDPRANRWSRGYASGFYRLERESLPPPTVRARRAV